MRKLKLPKIEWTEEQREAVNNDYISQGVEHLERYVQLGFIYALYHEGLSIEDLVRQVTKDLFEETESFNDLIKIKFRKEFFHIISSERYKLCDRVFGGTQDLNPPTVEMIYNYIISEANLNYSKSKEIKIIVSKDFKSIKVYTLEEGFKSFSISEIEGVPRYKLSQKETYKEIKNILGKAVDLGHVKMKEFDIDPESMRVLMSTLGYHIGGIGINMRNFVRTFVETIYDFGDE